MNPLYNLHQDRIMAQTWGRGKEQVGVTESVFVAERQKWNPRLLIMTDPHCLPLNYCLD